MSREIKFRAWDGQTMRDVRSIHNVHSQVNVHADLCTVKDDPLSNKAVISSHYTEYNLKLHLMQYTGLKDRNGVEIYEGDVIKYITQYYGNKREHQKVVGWIDDMQDDSFGEPLSMGYRFHGGDIEVIGNIYETPDLLTNKGER